MPDNSEAQSAIEALNNKEFEGRTVKVNAVRPRTENRGGRSDSGGGRRGEKHGGRRRFQ